MATSVLGSRHVLKSLDRWPGTSDSFREGVACKIEIQHDQQLHETYLTTLPLDTSATDISTAIAAANNLTTVTASDSCQSLQEIVKAPYTYLEAKSGQNFRTKLLHTCNVWLQIDPHLLDVIDSVIETLHVASLLIDDIQDSSTLRRGATSAHLVFGVAQTINSSNYMYFCAQEMLKGLPRGEEAFCIFTEELMHLHEGQGMDLYWRDTLTLPTTQQYFQMISGKTGGLFRLLGRLMMLCSPTEIDILPLLGVLGIWYQVRDDYCNLKSDAMKETKGFAEDLTEGKFSLPILHAAAQSPSKKSFIWDVLRMKPKDFAIKRRAVDYIRDVTGSLDYTIKIAEGLQIETEQRLSQLPPNSMFNAVVKKLKEV